MRRLWALLLFPAFATLASAQSRAFTAPNRGFSSPLGSTSAIAGQARPLGGVAGGPGFRGTRGFTHAPRGRFAPGVYGFSTYVPGYWDFLGDPVGPYSYTWPYVLPPMATSAGPAGPPMAPAGQPVIINQYFGYPAPPGGPAQVESQPGAAANPGDPLTEPQTYYLIAYKDHSIYAALAWWMEGNTLHYVTTENTHNQVSLDLVDIPATTKLNKDHNVPFSIPGR